MPMKPTAAVLAKPREERTTTAGYAVPDESAQELHQAHDRLTRDYAELFLRKRRPETEEEYRRVARRAIDRADPPRLAHYHPRARAKVRTAVILLGVGKIAETLNTYFEGYEIVESDARAAALAEGHRWVARIRAVTEPIDKDGASDNKMSRNPARRKLRALPDGWELLVFEAARSFPNWFNGVCVSLAIGVRPVELERGVLVRREGSSIELIVESAKASELHEGIGKRSLLLAPETPWVQALADELGERTEMVARWPSAKKSFDTIAGIGRLALPDAKVAISGYLLRHRFASLLKKAKWAPIEIARALGHSSTKQLSSYGMWNGAVRGGSFPLQVRSEREPRVIGKPRGFISRQSNGPKGPVTG
jgi:hypothetical protein